MEIAKVVEGFTSLSTLAMWEEMHNKVVTYNKVFVFDFDSLPFVVHLLILLSNSPSRVVWIVAVWFQLLMSIYS